MKWSQSLCMALPSQWTAFEPYLQNSFSNQPPGRGSPSLSPCDIDNLADDLSSRLNSIMPSGFSPIDVKPQVQQINEQALVDQTYRMQLQNFGQQLSIPAYSLVTPVAKVATAGWVTLRHASSASSTTAKHTDFSGQSFIFTDNYCKHFTHTPCQRNTPW